MHIAICDDDQDELSRISLLLDKFIREQNAPITYKSYQSGVELLFTAQNGGYSLYFLDVLMPGLNGIEVAKEIRSFCSEAPIVFLTSSPEFAVASYTVKARDYLLKPVDEGRFFGVLNELIMDSQKPQEGLTVKAKLALQGFCFQNLSMWRL